jgi:hypothetical protein
MSETNGREHRQEPFRDRKAHQDLGGQIQELLVNGKFLAADGRSSNEAADLGRLVIAFTALPDERVRTALISLMETVVRE